MITSFRRSEQFNEEVDSCSVLFPIAPLNEVEPKKTSFLTLRSTSRFDLVHAILASFVMKISGAKCEEHFINTSRDILYSVFYHSSCTPCDVITSLICKIQKR